MAMASRLRLSYHQRLFLLLLGFSWFLVACFVAFQYQREKHYKIEKLDAQLQMFNTHLIDALATDSIDSLATISRQRLPLEDLRISVINPDGTLAFDNTLDTLPAESHLSRHEIREAIENGSGRTIRRHSASTDNTYFYSATCESDIIVRSAVPYSVSLQEILQADRTFLWFMLGTTLCVSLAAYLATRRLGRTITRLNRFAEKAEKGERIYDWEPFPPDELGSISNHIVRLYARLQQTMTERDAEHSRALHEQQEKTRIKKQLTNNINHELKTPVASIKVCLETVLEHRNLPPEKLWLFIEQSLHHTDRLVHLLGDVSAITRMDDGAANISKEPLDIASIVAEVAESLAPQLERAGVTLDVRLPETLPAIGNRTFISSIFRNLMDNAIAYSGGDRIEISLEGETPEAFTFNFADNGSGIPAEHLDRIFERFYRIDKGRSRLMGGTGLGLSIVRNAVQLHGGTITASNLPEGGLKFTFTLEKAPKQPTTENPEDSE